MQQPQDPDGQRPDDQRGPDHPLDEPGFHAGLFGAQLRDIGAGRLAHGFDAGPHSLDFGAGCGDLDAQPGDVGAGRQLAAVLGGGFLRD